MKLSDISGEISKLQNIINYSKKILFLTLYIYLYEIYTLYKQRESITSYYINIYIKITYFLEKLIKNIYNFIRL